MKTTLTIALILTATSISAQTATISFNTESYLSMNGTRSEQMEELEYTDALTALFKFHIEDQRDDDVSTVPSTYQPKRIVETQSETWSLRNKENLTFQICRDYTDQHVHDSTTQPNPLYIGTVDIDIETIEVFDILGRVVHSTAFLDEVNRIPLDHLSEGIYYLVLRDKNQDPLYSQKLAIK